LLGDHHFRREIEEVLRRDAERGVLGSSSSYAARWPSRRELVAEIYKQVGGDGGDGSTDEGAGGGRPDGRPGIADASRAGTADDDAASRDWPDRVGPYRIEAELGRGGQGVVYRAVDTRVGRTVALKVLRNPGPATRELIARFRREAMVGSRLDDPGICPVYDTGLEESIPYIAMRFIEGTTLSQLISTRREEEGPTTHVVLPPVEGEPVGSVYTEREPGEGVKSPDAPEILRIVALFERAARSLHRVHEAGVIHRDIKPGNIMVTARDHLPVIMDFGLARGDDEDLQTLTRTGDHFGTPSYMSPEQLLLGIRVPLDARTDVWSIGVSLYECLTLHLPFQAPTRHGLYSVIQSKDPLDPSRLNARVSRDLSTVVLTTLEKDRDRRYQTALDLAEDLRRVRMREPILARPVSRWTRLIRWTQRNRGLAATVLAIAAGAVTATIFWLQARDNARTAVANADRADKNLLEWSRLADGRVLSDLLREAEEDLWPALPTKIGAMEVWLRNAETLVASLPDHERALAAVRDQALTYDAAARARNRASFREENARLEIIENDLGNLTVEEEKVSAARQAAEEAKAKAVDAEDESGTERAQADIDKAEKDAASLREKRTTLETERAALTAAIEKRVTWSFDDPDLRFRHDRLKELVEGLVSLEGPANPETVTLAGMVARLSLTRSLEETQVSEKSAWAQAAASIKQPDGPYGGLTLSPMAGLVPLGIDEDSKLWEFWHMASGSRPLWVGRPLGPGKVQLRSADDATGKVGDEGLVLVLLPGGTFRMGARVPDDDHPVGSPNVDPSTQMDESSVHEVTLAPFLLCKYEVTQGQWVRLWGANPSAFFAGQQYGPDRVTLRNPVTNLNWDQARETCRRWNLELPTEARWEFACRGGKGHVYWTGDDLGSLEGAANIADRTAAPFTPWRTEPDFGDGHVVHAPVDALRANGFGLHHVHGNVWEWCLDGYYRYDAWRSVRPGGGRGPVVGARGRVVRGGSFAGIAERVRSAEREWYAPGLRNSDLGFRPAQGMTP
jgi:serine/threonine protein kinase/formylglycine-generating enzyme required for sulfatase activity